jgi:hypothetical protein
VTGDYLTKYVCLLDLVERKMIYIDANLPGRTVSAEDNGKWLETNMPAFMEYIAALPSIYDLFRGSVHPKGEADIPYSDKGIRLDGKPAYIFRPENKENTFKPVDINQYLR